MNRHPIRVYGERIGGKVLLPTTPREKKDISVSVQQLATYLVENIAQVI